MQPLQPRLKPSPSPQPAEPIPTVSASPRSGRKSSNRRHKVPAIQGDAVLIHYLGGGKQPDIEAEAATKPLAEYEDDLAEGSFDDSETDSSTDEPVKHPTTPPISPDPRSPGLMTVPSAKQAASPPGSINLLTSLAADALSLSAQQPAPRDDAHMADAGNGSPESARDGPSPHYIASPPQPAQMHQKQPHVAPLVHSPPSREILTSPPSKPVLAAPISQFPLQSPQDIYSPRRQSMSQVLRHPSEVQSPTSVHSAHGELAPLQMPTPRSESNGHAPLPSIRSTLGDQLHEQPKHADKELALRHPHSPFPNSPPGAGAPRMIIHPGSHSSPPISPNYTQSLPSPAQTLPAISPYGYYHSVNGNHGSGRGDYNSSSTATPSTEPASTPATSTSIADRMSIDNMTNQPVGSFVCSVPGCNAPPFQTQYLLNSHANVHSSVRPHYCPVKGCSRAEGGKGFKRKNEMIRHGLVHESPGYVCPFCADREHKYPRPDNLQRHVRVHHIDKDKDDPLLRDVLSQRPDGPNRGRRRRGGP